MPVKKNKQSAVPQVVRIEPLELRVLYSAELAPFLALNDSANELSLEPVATDDWLKPTETDSPLNANAAASLIVTELVIVDSSQSDIDELEKLLESQLEQQRQVKLITLDAEDDALEAITQILSQYSNLDAVHIISHATEGSIQLGNQTVDQSDLVLNSELVKQWGSSFSDGGDLLLYGCNLSATDYGREFAKTLSDLTETDVASSSDITGHALRDGNWDLEISEGQIETAVIADAQLQDDWTGSLDITSGLIHHWALDGDGIDSVGAANFSMINSVGAPTGLINQAGDFSENTTAIKYGFVQSGLSPNYGSSDFGIAFWMHVNSANDGAKMFGDLLPGNAGYSLTLDATGRLVFTVENASTSHVVVGSESVTDTDWRHVTATRIGGTLELIVYNKATNTFDKQVFNSGQPAVALTNFNLLMVGTTDQTVGDYDGLLDDIRLYDRALTDQDSADLVAMVVGGGFIVNNEGAVVSAGLPTLISSAELLTVSDGVPASQIEYLITTNPTGHQFYVSGVPVSIGGSFSQQDINDGVVTVVGDGTADSILLKINDRQGNPTNAAFDIYPGVAGNTAPTAGSALLTVSEDDTDPAGATVFDLIDPTFTDLDAGDSLAGILISEAVVDSTEGRWQYSTNNGVAWHDVGIANSSDALAISATTEMRFLPAPNFSGIPSGLSFHAVQSFAGSMTAPFTYTSGSIRTEMPVTPNGGTTAISADTGLVTVTVTALDDSPTISMKSNSIDVAESETIGTIIGSIKLSDLDSGDTLTIDILDAASGAISTAVGVNNLNQLELFSGLDFESQTNPQLIGRVTDSAGLSDSVPFTVNILDVNEPPETIAPAVIADVDGDDINSAGQRVGDIAGASFWDQDAGQSLWGIAIVGHDVNASSGHWEYQLGGNWYNVGITNSSDALVLHKDTYLRFVPAQNYSGPVSDLRFHVLDSAYIGPAPAFTSNLFTMHVDHVSPTAEIATGQVLPVNVPPTDLYSTLGLSIPENATFGQSVGSVSGIDFDSTDLSYALLANADGRFTIDPQSGEVTLLSAADIDHEINSFHQIIVEVTDPANEKYQENFLVQVLDVDEAPTFIGPVILNAVMEDDTVPPGQTVNDIFSSVFDDVDDGDSLGGVAIVADNSVVSEGEWQFFDGSAWSSIPSVSANNALVLSVDLMLRFLPAAGYEGAVGHLLAHALDSTYFSTAASAGAHFNTSLFSATNSSISLSGVAVTQQVLPVNDAPSNIVASSTLLVAENTPGVSISTMNGVDVDDSNLIYALANNAGGRLEIDSITGELSLSAGIQLDYESQSTHLIRVEVRDPSGSSFEKNYTVTVIDLPERPSLIANVQVADQVEDNFALIGQSVDNLFTPVFSDQDIADTLEGIAIVENASSAMIGRWQYLSSGGWTDIGVVSFSNSLILGKDDALRFVPLSNYFGPVDTLSIHAIDNTAGVPIVSHYSNSAFDSTGTPISNALSINPVSLGGEVLPQNDSPTIAPLLMLTSINEDELNPSGESIVSLLIPGFNDIDAGHSLAGVAVVANSATANEGQWQYNINDSGWQSVGLVSPTNALMLSALDDIRFLPNADFNGIPSGLSVFALDSTYTGAFSSQTAPAYSSDLVADANSSLSQSSAHVQTMVLPVDDLPTIQLQALNTSLAEDVDTSVAIDVATIVVNDIDTGSHTLTLSGSHASYFQITGNLLQLKPGVVLDAEIELQLDVFVNVDDATNGVGVDDSALANLLINNINEQPVLSNVETSTLVFSENSGFAAVSNSIAILDIDSNQLAGAVIKFVSGYEPSEDALVFSNQSGISGLFNGVTGELSLQGAATVAQYQAALQSVMYINSSEYPSAAVRELQFSVSDGLLDSNILSRNIVVQGVNDEPDLVISAGVTVLPTQTINISNVMLSSSDVDHSPSDITYTNTSVGSTTQWLLDGIPVNAFTQEDIDLGKVSLQTDGAVAGPQALTLSLDDSESAANSILFEVIVEPVPEPEPIIGAALPEPVGEPEQISFIPESVLSFVEALEPATVASLTPAPQSEPILAVTQAGEPASAEQPMQAQADTSQEESEATSGTGSDLLTQAILSELNVPDFIKQRDRSLGDDFESDVGVENRTIHRTVELSKMEINELQLASILSLEPLSISEQSSFVNFEDNTAFNASLEQLQKELASSTESINTGVVARDTVIGISLSVTAGFLVWLLRGGALLASMFSISPLWQQFDPLPIFNNQSDNENDNPDDDSVEAMFEDKRR